MNRLADIQAGHAETRTLMDALALDIPALIRTAFPDYQAIGYDPSAGITRRMALSAHALRVQYGNAVFDELLLHRSDTMRGIVCYGIAQQCEDFETALMRIYPLANDAHVGVREWAWLALRPHFLGDVDRSLQLLDVWARDTSSYIRRFASEISRPRGVWCAHSELLKKDPSRALPLLEILRADTERYVQRSVGNWLNDASKDNPTFVVALCEQWHAESRTIATQKIIAHGLRTLRRMK